MPKKDKIKCPTCAGVGIIDQPGLTLASRIKRRTKIAKDLRKEGYSIREIMALMGYKSTNSVAILLKSNKND